MPGDLPSAGATTEAFFQAHQRDFNRLQDPNRSVRQSALQNFNNLLSKANGGSPATDAQHLEALCSNGLLPPFLALLSDPVEKGRELAALIIQAIVANLSQVDAFMEQIMPAVKARIGGSPMAETSEEVRLQLLTLLADHLLPKCVHPSAPVMQDGALVLSQAVHDPYHEIKKAACRGIAAGAQQCPAALAPHAELLLKALLQNVGHPHSRVRSAIVQGLDAVVSTGGLPAGSLTDLLPQGVKPLAFDKASAVRELLFSSIAHWFGVSSGNSSGLSTPAFDPHPYVLSLLPLLLVGVTDPSPDIATLTLDLVEQVGTRLNEPPEASHPQDMDTSQEAGPSGGASLGNSELPSDHAHGPQRGPPLPPPYKGRPGRGIQRVVGQHMRELLRPLQRELREWTLASRKGAARILHTLLVLGGESLTGHVDVIVPMLCAAVGDEDGDVAQRIVSCGHVVGAAVSPVAWVPIMGDELTAPRASSAQKANRLVILAALLHATEGGDLAVEHVAQIAQMVVGEELRCSEHAAVRAQLLSVVTNLVRAAGTACAPVSLPLLQTLLQLQAPPTDAALQRAAAAVTVELSRSSGHPSASSLFSHHLSALMAATTVDAPHWTAASSNAHLFQALLRSAGGALGPGLEDALRVLVASVGPERAATLRISMLQLVDELLESPPLAPFWSSLTGRLLTELLVPGGVWRAGKVAAAVRHAAMVATGTLLRRNLCSQEQLVDVINGSSLLAVVRSCLEEDYYVDTRRAACHVMEHLVRIAGPALNQEQRQAVYADALKRLDDSNDDVRIEITGTARLLFASLPASETETEVRKLIDGLLVHMDDPEARVQDAVCRALEVAATVRGALVEQAVESVQQRHRSQEFTARVLAAAKGK